MADHHNYIKRKDRREREENRERKDGENEGQRQYYMYMYMYALLFTKTGNIVHVHVYMYCVLVFANILMIKDINLDHFGRRRSCSKWPFKRLINKYKIIIIITCNNIVYSTWSQTGLSSFLMTLVLCLTPMYI